MFPPTYFPPTYFTPGYFSGGSGSTPATYARLAEAVFAQLSATITASLPGGYWAGMAPNNHTTYPLATYIEIGEVLLGRASRGLTITDAQFQITTYHTSTESAFSVAEAIRLAIEDANLIYVNRSHMLFREVNRIMQIDPSPAPDGNPLYAEIRMYRAVHSRSIGV